MLNCREYGLRLKGAIIYFQFFLLPFFAVAQGSSRSQDEATASGRSGDMKQKDIDWQSYDSASIVKIGEISPKDLQGTWIAIKGIYRFKNTVQKLNLAESTSMEVVGDTYRQNGNGGFRRFIISSNLMISTRDSGHDTAVINKLTESSLIISWKSGDNYSRYIYTK